MSVCLKN